MRNQRSGQATFIPLDTIQVKPINDKFRAFAKGTRLAVDVVQYDQPAIQRAVHHVCGNAVVCDTLEVAKYVCYEKGQEVKGAFFVSVDKNGRVLMSVGCSGDFGRDDNT
jgi:structural maintenance of chromosome 1